MTRIIVAGGGRVGRQVAMELNGRDNVVTVVERDAGRAAELEGEGIPVVCGDACLAEVLEEAGGLRADVLVACTGADSENLLMSTVAKLRLEIPRVVARVNDTADRWLFDRSSGVDAAVSSALALISLIEEATGSAAVVRLADLVSLGLVLVEGKVGPGSVANGRCPSELALGDRDTVAVVIRDGRPVELDESLRLAVADRVLFLTDAGGESRLRTLF